jgi:hypothetical protein
MPSPRRAAPALALTLLASGSVVSATTAATAETTAATAPASSSAGRAWFTSWAQSQQELAPTPLRDQSVRMITHLGQGGGALRVRIQNTFGTTPLTVDAATVGHSAGDGAAVEGDVLPVTFDGRREVVVPAGGEVWSDAAALKTRAQDDVAVSLSVSGTVAPGRHTGAFRSNYLTAPGSGDHTAEASGDAYTQTVGSTYLVSAVDVHNPKLRGTNYIPDFLWPDQGLILEADSRRFHGNMIARADDATRQLVLETMGLRVIRTTWREATTQPAVVQRRVAEALRPGVG